MWNNLSIRNSWHFLSSMNSADWLSSHTNQMAENSENINQTTNGLRVLLVDDQDDLLQVMHILLQRRRGYQVETAQSGHQAMQKAPDFAPHVVVSDITMPGMDGCELMQNLRRLEGEEISPFRAIALSGYDTLNDSRFTQCGYD